MAGRFILTILLAIMMLQADSGAPAYKRTARLLEAINSVNTSTKISLIPAENFEEIPGRVIFISREEGLKRLLALARSDEPELFMLFLPKWNAWITVSVEREFDTAWLYKSYLTAVVSSGLESHFCHTHNAVQPGSIRWSDEERIRESLGWIMPSSGDLEILRDYARDYPDARVLGVIANIQGITEYWYDKTKKPEVDSDNEEPLVEGYTLNYMARSSSLSQMPSLLADYKGYISLKFTPVP